MPAAESTISNTSGAGAPCRVTSGVMSDTPLIVVGVAVVTVQPPARASSRSGR